MQVNVLKKLAGLAIAPVVAGSLLFGSLGVATAEEVQETPLVEVVAEEGVEDAPDDSAEAAAAGYGKPITRAEVIKRAKYWWDKKVPYNQRATYRDINNGKKYRTDCSGFVSMAWKLTSSRTTHTLPAVSRSIGWKSLKPGDIVLSRGHVKLFEKWANADKTVMWIYEQGSTRTDMDHEKVSVKALKNGGYEPRAYKKIK
ncbi:hypothetical protein [Saccharothrix obliqua]|uniref:hypothetical protein n=1 Tax=Saccharothrix obliqua TaxID=2861747 RepID=UPI001C5CF7D5|nr:hypothetical protein [Saccharothrix obliqua]MBW4721511.1 hypothetical protein [Saccharothrix obliqua]